LCVDQFICVKQIADESGHNRPRSLSETGPTQVLPGANVVCCDGAVRPIAFTVAPEQPFRACAINDGEVLELP